MKNRRQLIYDGFQGKDSLGGSIAPVRACGKLIRIDYVKYVTEGLQVGRIQGNRLVSRQSRRSGAVVAVSACIGQVVKINGPDRSVPVCAYADPDVHLMTGRAGNLAFFSGIDELGGLLCHPGNKGRINLRHHRLFGAEAAAYPGLHGPHLCPGNPEGRGYNSSYMEYDLGRAYYHQSSIGIDIAIGPEGLHHGLVDRRDMVGAGELYLTVLKDRLHISVAVLHMGAEIPPVVGSHREPGFPVVLRMHQDFIVDGLMIIQQCRKHLVFHPDHPQGLVHAVLILACYNRYRIAHEAHMLIENQMVVGAPLRIGLSRCGKPVLRHVFPGIHRLDTRNLQGRRVVYVLHDGIGMGAAKKLYHQTFLRGEVIYIDRLSRNQRYGVLLAFPFSYFPHAAPPFFLYSIKACIPRSCPS